MKGETHIPFLLLAIISSSWCEYYKDLGIFATKMINSFVSLTRFSVFFTEVAESGIYRANSIK